MKFTPSSTARRRVAMAAVVIGGGSPDALAGDSHCSVADAIYGEVAEGDCSGGRGGNGRRVLRHGDFSCLLGCAMGGGDRNVDCYVLGVFD